MRLHGPWHSGSSLDEAAVPAHRIIRPLLTILTIAFVALILVLSPTRASAAGQLTVEPGAAYFGGVWIGRMHSIRATVKNSGNSAVTISGQTLAGNGYGVSGLTLPQILSAGQTLTFEISFSPSKVGAVSGKLHLISNAANSMFTLALYGEGVTSEAAPYVTAQPLSARFGDVPVGTQNTEIIEVKNTSARSLSITNVTAKGTGFSVSGISLPLSLPAGNSARLTVGFLPKSAGNFSGSVDLKSTASDSQLTVVVSGTGVGSSRVLEATPASIAFGDVNVSASETQQITLKNAGNSNISISAETVKGSGLRTTGIARGTTLTPGQMAVVNVEFVSTTVGTISGTVTITSNAANGAVAIPVKGTGVAAIHVVNLQWQASASNGVIGYDVYRSTVSGGSYTKLTNSPVSGTGYSDSKVTGGMEYYYVVTAVSSDGSQSGYSNQASIKVP